MREGKDPITFAVDYLNEWQLGTGQSIVPIELLNRLNLNGKNRLFKFVVLQRL